MSFGKVLVGGLAKPGFGLGRVAFARHSFVPPNLDPDRTVVRTVARRFSENHLCGAKELFASPRKFFRIPPPLSIETLRKSAENPGFLARVSFFCPRLRFFTQDRPFCMARELILATIDD